MKGPVLRLGTIGKGQSQRNPLLIWDDTRHIKSASIGWRDWQNGCYWRKGINRRISIRWKRLPEELAFEEKDLLFRDFTRTVKAGKETQEGQRGTHKLMLCWTTVVVMYVMSYILYYPLWILGDWTPDSVFGSPCWPHKQKADQRSNMPAGQSEAGIEGWG